MESIQDLLAPEKINIPIVEDAKTREVSVPGATLVKIQDLDHFLQLLQIGEANRLAANTKFNTELLRSHAILMVNIRKSVKIDEETNSSFGEKDSKTDRHGNQIPIVRKSKLLIVCLAGSERIDKSALKEALAHIRVCSKLEGLLLKKKALKYGDSPEVHVQKVDKLKVLSESLASSTCKAEKKISDIRIQKEEALKFHVTKTSEVGEIEKGLVTEVSALEKQRDEIEAQLKQSELQNRQSSGETADDTFFWLNSHPKS